MPAKVPPRFAETASMGGSLLHGHPTRPRPPAAGSSETTAPMTSSSKHVASSGVASLVRPLIVISTVLV